MLAYVASYASSQHWAMRVEGSPLRVRIFQTERGSYSISVPYLLYTVIPVSYFKHATAVYRHICS